MLLTCVALLQGSSKVPEQRVMGTTLVRELDLSTAKSVQCSRIFQKPGELQAGCWENSGGNTGGLPHAPHLLTQSLMSAPGKEQAEKGGRHSTAVPEGQSLPPRKVSGLKRNRLH